MVLGGPWMAFVGLRVGENGKLAFLEEPWGFLELQQEFRLAIQVLA